MEAAPPGSLAGLPSGGVAAGLGGPARPAAVNSSLSRPFATLRAMQAAKRKSWLGELWRPLAALLLWVVGCVAAYAAPPLLPSLAETRIGGLTAFPVDCIPAVPLFSSDLTRACGPPLYDLASGCSVAAKRTKQGGAITEPTLPPKTVVSQDGVTIQHYTRSGDHAPAHLHVKGEGAEVKIGQNGKPLKGEGELSGRQQDVVDANAQVVENAVDKIQRWHRFEQAGD